MNTNKLTRNTVAAFVLILIVFSTALSAGAAGFGTCYDGQAAVDYAASHWDDGVGVCDQFVKDCLLAGGVEILAGGVDPLKNALLSTGLGTQKTLKISADGIHALASENPGIQSGDILFFFCKTCNVTIHTAILGGSSDAGYLYAYAHNPGWDKVDWFGNFTHTLSSGEKHRGCYDLYVISMDRTNYSHPHSFASDLYEESHPHKMYASCSCGAKYYLGWNATVSYCTTCNPPVSTVPVLTATAGEDHISLQWTTVEDALEYQVWRAKSADGTYFNIYSAMGTKMVNRSVEAGTDYYYKVIAVLEKNSAGIVTKSAESAIVRCALSGTPVLPGTPAISGKLNASNKAVITWNAVSDAAKYEVWRSTSETGTYKKLITTAKLTCTNSPVPGTYYYKVRAVDSSGATGPYSNTVCITVPSAAERLTVTGSLSSANKAVISWNAMTGAAKYEVWRSASENGTYTKLITTAKLTCTNSPVPGTYYYKVRPVGSNGTAGAYSNTVCVTVPSVTNRLTVTGSLSSANKAVISWNAMTGAAKYEVWRSTSENGTYIRLITTTKLTCTNSPVPGTYYYKVRPVSSNGTAGTYSNTVCVTVPSATDRLTVTGSLSSANKAVISWNAVNGAAKYEVWRSTSENGTYIRLITTTKLTCTNSPVPGTYYYKVRSVDANGNKGIYSNIVCVTVN